MCGGGANYCLGCCYTKEKRSFPALVGAIKIKILRPICMEFTRFGQSLLTSRVLKAYNDGSFILDAAPQVMQGQACDLPSVVFEDADEVHIKTSSYARTPGIGSDDLESHLKNILPRDFTAFYEQYSEALIVTRSYPIHLWPINKMLDSIRLMRQREHCPIRFFRFGEQWDREAVEYGLLQHTPGKDDWWVIATSREYHDDYYDDENLTDYNLLGYSFKSWLEDWITRDGLPDPLMGLGVDGGFLDPI